MGKNQKPVKRWKHLFSALIAGRNLVVLKASVFIAGFLCCGAYSVRLGSFNTWDLRNYQYYSPFALLHGRFDFDYAAAQIQTFLNPLPFVPFYVITTHFKPVAAGFIMGGIHGLAAGFLFLTALTLFSSMSPLSRLVLSLSCTALGIYGPTFLGMLGGSGNDNLVCFIVLAAVYMLIRGITLYDGLDARVSRRILLIAGGLIGIAAGLKLTCTIFLLGCGIAIIATGRRWHSRLTSTGLFGLAGVLGILLSRGFWMAFLWSRFGSPLFPFYNKIFQSPYYYDTNFADIRFIPKTLASAVLFPFYFFTNNHFTNISHQFRDIRYTLAYVLILIFLIVLAGKSMNRRRQGSALLPLDRPRTFLLVFFFASYAIWQMKFAIMRYIVPLELLAPLVIVILIRTLLPGRPLRTLVTIAAFIAVAVIMQPREVPRQAWSSTYIDVVAPKFDNPRDALVIIANNRPWAYVIPFFQSEIRFVGLCNNFSHPNPETQHQAAEEMFTLVKAHRGRIYLLSNIVQLNKAMQCLQPYSIVRTSDTCLPIISKHEQVSLCLWPLEVR